MPDENGHLRRRDGHEHVHDQRHDREADEEPDQNEQATQCLYGTDEGAQHRRQRDANLGKSPGSERVGIQEFLQPLR